MVEGYFDVIACAAGVTNAVASLGTALSGPQITQLCRCCDGKRIVLNFDADGAGVRAANRAIGEVEQLALQGQLELRVLHLPSGKDPDDFLKDHGAGDYGSPDQAPLWLDWQIEQVLEDGSQQGRSVPTFRFRPGGTAGQAASVGDSHPLHPAGFRRLSGGQGRLAFSWRRICASRCRAARPFAQPDIEIG